VFFFVSVQKNTPPGKRGSSDWDFRKHKIDRLTDSQSEPHVAYQWSSVRDSALPTLLPLTSPGTRLQGDVLQRHGPHRGVDRPHPPAYVRPFPRTFRPGTNPTGHTDQGPPKEKMSPEPLGPAPPFQFHPAPKAPRFIAALKFS